MSGEPPTSPYAPPQAASTLHSESMGFHVLIVVSGGVACVLETIAVVLTVAPDLQGRVDELTRELVGPLALLAQWRYFVFLFALLSAEIAILLLMNALARSHRRGRVLGASGFKFSRTAILWLFVPVANLWMAYRVFAEYVRVARFDPADPHAWHTSPVPIVLPIWWSLIWSAGMAKALAHFVTDTERGTPIELFDAIVSCTASVLVLAALVSTMKLSAVLVALWQDRGAEADALLVEERNARRRARHEKRRG